MISTHEPSSHHHGNRNRLAVLVGVNHYDDNLSFGQLTVCAHDATKLAEHLVTGGFEPRRIHLLTDQEEQEKWPLYAIILTKLEVVAKATEEDDLLLFYFSGHGQIDAETGKAYLIPRNGTGAALRRTAIAIQDVKEIMLNAKAKQKVIVLDACHSGANSGIKASRSMSPSFIENVFTQAEGLAIISSCTGGQFSYEWPEKECSVFTFYLLEALRGHADRAHKGCVTVQDVNWHVVNGVKDWATEHSVSQTPRLNYLVEGDIPITYYDIQNARGDLPSTNRALAIHTFKPVAVTARTYFTAIQKIAEEARTSFIQPSLPWSFQCDKITQSFYQVTQPTIPDIGPADDIQLNSFMIKYHYIAEQVARIFVRQKQSSKTSS
jgi:caspase domain-containing protein